MMTSFTRIVVVLSLFRTALGTATAPNAVIVALALFLTAFAMGPAFQVAYDTGVKPLLANEITTEQAFERGSQPFRAFMLKNVRDKDQAVQRSFRRAGAGTARGAVAAHPDPRLHDL